MNTKFQTLKKESLNLIRLAIPILIAQISGSVIAVTDAYMSSLSGTMDLAAISLGGAYWCPFFVFCVAFTLCLAPLVAHSIGAKSPDKIPVLFWNTFLLAGIIGLLSMLAVIFIPFLLNGENIDPLLAHKTQNYCFWVGLGIFGTSLGTVIKNCVEGCSRSVPSMVIGFTMITVNIPLNWLLIYGNLGFPALGVEGCGIATCISMWLTLILFFIYSKRSRFLKARNINLYGDGFPVEKETIKKILFAGIPLAFGSVIEVIAMSVLGYAAALLGPEYAAGHQIVNCVCIFTYVLPLSIGAAVAIRVGQSLGEGSRAKVKNCIISALILSGILIYPFAALIFSFRQEISSAFTDNPMVCAIGSSLFTAILVYQIFDPLFGVGSGIVRGFNDNKTVFVGNLCCFLCIAIPAGYALGFSDIFGRNYGLLGMWLTLSGSYALLSIIYWLRSFSLVGRMTVKS